MLIKSIDIANDLCNEIQIVDMLENKQNCGQVFSHEQLYTAFALVGTLNSVCVVTEKIKDKKLG